MPQLRNVVVVALLTLLIAATASAALSPQYTEWRNGPIQWIMTGAEKGACGREGERGPEGGDEQSLDGPAKCPWLTAQGGGGELDEE